MKLKQSLSLVGPDIVGDITDKLKLVDHAVPVDSITLAVGSKSTLGADTDLVKSSIKRDVVTLGDELGSINDTILHLLLILELGELASDDTQDDILVDGKEFEGLKATRARSVVLKVVGVHVQLLEKLDSDTVIATLGEVTAADEVTAAQVNTDVHISGKFGEAVVVLLDVLLEHVIGGVHVQRVLLEAVKELLGAEV